MSTNYSIIIPHKNSIRLLMRCIQSIPVRNDIQVIVVDDNSDYISQREWDNVKKANHNLQVFYTREGKGAGFARNYGLKKSQGKWILFVDADDFLHKDAFDKIDKYLDSDHDIIYFAHDSKDGESLDTIPDRLPQINHALTQHDYNKLRYCAYAPWGKLIKKDFIDYHNIRFDEIEVSNDVMFSLKCGHYASKIGVLDETLYCCTANKGSLFFKTTIKRAEIRLQIIKNANAFLHKHDKDSYRFTFDDSAHWLKTFLPRRPSLFAWWLINAKYNNDTKHYVIDILNFAKASVSNRVSSLAHNTPVINRNVFSYVRNWNNKPLIHGVTRFARKTHRITFKKRKTKMVEPR